MRVVAFHFVPALSRIIWINFLLKNMQFAKFLNGVVFKIFYNVLSYFLLIRTVKYTLNFIKIITS